jgi:hypothetical protein
MPNLKTDLSAGQQFVVAADRNVSQECPRRGKSAPIAADPNVATSVPGPMSPNPNGVRSWTNDVMTSGPDPAAANADRPVAGHPNIVRSGSYGDYLNLRWRRGLSHGDASRRGRLRLSIGLRCRSGLRSGSGSRRSGGLTGRGLVSGLGRIVVGRGWSGLISWLGLVCGNVNDSALDATCCQGGEADC